MIAQRLRPLGYRGSLTILKDHVRRVRPDFIAARSFQRTSYLPGELAQTDWWEPPVTVPVGKGQHRPVFGLVTGLPFSAALRVVFTALREAVEPVYTELTKDADTAEFIAEIEDLKASITAEPLTIPDGCTGPAPSGETVVAEGTGDPSVLNGSYRLEWAADELFAALLDPPVPPLPGPPPPELEQEMRRDAERNAGVVILSFEDGSFDDLYESGLFAGQHCAGTYAVTDNRVTMVATTDAAEWQCGSDSLGALFVDAAWERTDGKLVLSDFALPDEPGITWWNVVFLGGKPLVEVD